MSSLSVDETFPFGGRVRGGGGGGVSSRSSVPVHLLPWAGQSEFHPFVTISSPSRCLNDISRQTSPSRLKADVIIISHGRRHHQISQSTSLFYPTAYVTITSHRRRHYLIPQQTPPSHLTSTSHLSADGTITFHSTRHHHISLHTSPHSTANVTRSLHSPSNQLSAHWLSTVSFYMDLTKPRFPLLDSC